MPVIPGRSNATKKACCPKRFYRRRQKIENDFCRIKEIENGFCRIKDWRRIAARHDKPARSYLDAAALAGALY